MTKIVQKENNNKNLIIGGLVIAIVAVFFLGTMTGQAMFQQKTVKSALTSAQKVEVLSMLHNNCKFNAGVWPQGYMLNESNGKELPANGDKLCRDLLPGSTCILVLAQTFETSEQLLDCKEDFWLASAGKISYMCCKP